MSFRFSVSEFLASEDGAVVTDWVVLTAGLTGLLVVVAISVSAGTVGYADHTGDTISQTAMLKH